MYNIEIIASSVSVALKAAKCATISRAKLQGSIYTATDSDGNKTRVFVTMRSHRLFAEQAYAFSSETISAAKASHCRYLAVVDSDTNRRCKLFEAPLPFCKGEHQPTMLHDDFGDAIFIYDNAKAMNL